MKEAISVAAVAASIIAILAGALFLKGGLNDKSEREGVLAKIRRMIGTGPEAADNIAFWLVYGIPGIIIIAVAIGAIGTYFVLWLSKVL